MQIPWKSIVIVIFLVLAGLGFYASGPLARADTVTQVIRESVWIEAPNRFEIQGKNECTGFAVAYVLRHFEIEVTGKEIYDAVRFKLPSGRVLPRGPINELRRHGIQAQVYTGTLNTLKARLSMGNPIIVITGDGLKWMHYFVLVGYDEPTKELHFYDPEIAEYGNGKAPGNRILTEEQFLKLWNTHIPGFRNIYIVCTPSEGRHNSGLNAFKR